MQPACAASLTPSEESKSGSLLAAPERAVTVVPNLQMERAHGALARLAMRIFLARARAKTGATNHE